MGGDAVFAVVGGALGGVAEDAVGGGDAGEAVGCVGVGAVSVWVVAEGEGVELSVWFALDSSFFKGGIDGERYFLISAVVAVMGTSRTSYRVGSRLAARHGEDVLKGAV